VHTIQSRKGSAVVSSKAARNNNSGWLRGFTASWLRGSVVLAALALPACAQQGYSAVSSTQPSDGYQRQDQRPPILQQVGIDQHLNQQLPLNLQFKDESGKDVKLGDYFGKKPIILSLVYYKCPMLCTEVLNGMASALGVLNFSAGKEFDIVTVSIDPREAPADAAKTKEVYVHRYGRASAAQGWHFLTGQQDQIQQLAKAVGFRYVYDPRIQQFAHASGIQIATPDGRLAQYYYGIEYSPKDLRLGLIEASKNHIGTVVDALVLYCYHYDPTTGHYGAIALRVMRLGGILTVLLLGGFVITMVRRDVREGRANTGRTP
jgi:protein SCO1/2